MRSVDVSEHGALVEGEARLLPGTHVDVHIVTADGRVLVRSRVVRAYVCVVKSDRVTYRCALAFDRRVDTSPRGYQVPAIAGAPSADSGPIYPLGDWAGDRSLEESL